MVNGYIVISAILAFIFVILGSAVVYRNPRATTNKLFLFFSVSIALWLVTNYLGSTRSVPYDIAFIANRLVFAFGALSTVALLGFSRNLVNLNLKDGWRYVLGLNLLIIIGCASPWIVEDVRPQGDTYAITFGWLSALYFLTLLFNFLVIIVGLLRSRNRVKGVQRQQANAVLISLAVTLAAILSTNAVLPFAFGFYGLTNAGSLFASVLVIGIGYSIIRHKLFDLRLVIARSVAYILAVAVLVSLYIGILFGLTQIFFDTKLSVGQQIYLGVFSAVIALLFQPVKVTFDHVTARLFFRSTYDPQDFLDKLSGITSNTLQLSTIVDAASVLIADDFKVQSCEFILLKQNGDIFEYNSAHKPKVRDRHYDSIKQIPKGASKTLLFSSESLDPKLKSILAKVGAEVIVTLEANNVRVGYVLLGLKSNGQTFNGQDLRVLSIGADSLAVSMQNALRFEEISRFNVTLQKKIDDATLQLRKTNEKLKALDETKDDFISMASHQLRTPLTSIKGYLSMVLEGDAGKLTGTERKMLTQAFASSQRMVYLISDLLNVSRLRTGKFVINAEPINLADLITDEIAQLKEAAATRSLTLAYNKPAHFPKLMLDETKTRQVVMNFVDNAIYYTPAGGHVVVEVIDKPASIELRVSDDGIGVPKAEQHHLFTKFYRARNARKARPDGTGLGLFMAKKVVVAQGGAVIFKSQEGKGSTFGFTFSKSKLAPPPSPTISTE